MLKAIMNLKWPHLILLIHIPGCAWFVSAFAITFPLKLEYTSQLNTFKHYPSLVYFESGYKEKHGIVHTPPDFRVIPNNKLMQKYAPRC